MGRRWVLATGNAGKLREFRARLADHGIELVAQSELAITSPPETGSTFIENALIKARHAAERSGLPALADDSGLVVQALDGRPGVYSARFAGPDASDQDNVMRLLEELTGSADRRAHFCCALVLVRTHDDAAPLICEGRWAGEILAAPRGAGGFGYDPVFRPAQLDQSAAELDLAIKNRISHRARALDQLLAALRNADGTAGGAPRQP